MKTIPIKFLVSLGLLFCVAAHAKVSGTVYDYRQQVGIPGVQISVLQGEKVVATQASNLDGFYAFDQLPAATPLNLRFELPGYVRRPTIKLFEATKTDLIINVFLLKESDPPALVAARFRERLARNGANLKDELNVLDDFGLKYTTLNTIIDRAAELGSPQLQEMTGSKEKKDGGPSPRTLNIEKENLAELCIKQGAWIAYFQDDKGSQIPVRDTENTDHDGDWIGLRFTDFDQPRIRLGVLKVIDKAGNDETENLRPLISETQEAMTVALYKTNRFDVLDERRIQEVEREPNRKDVSEPSPSSIMNVGKVFGAQYLVYITINEWKPTGRGHRTLGSSGGSENMAEASATFYLADVATGYIVFTTTERMRAGERDLVDAMKSKTKGAKSETDYALNALANKAAFSIARFLRNRRWRGSVVQVKGSDIYINAGSQQGMEPQTKLSVYSLKGLIRDPENHTILGEDMQGIGALEVTIVEPEFSIARVVEGGKEIKSGDRVELGSEPVPSKELPECTAPSDPFP